MKISIAQDHKYAGNDYWNWRAWIGGKQEDLDRIELVKWLLHPSFSPSVVVARERSKAFRLESRGWGTFTLRAEVQCVDGDKQTLSTPLALFYPDEETAAKAKATRPSAPGAPPRNKEEVAREVAERNVRKVFLSYASADRRVATTIRRSLETLGMKVLDASTIEPGQPFQTATLDLLTSADVTVAYVSSDLPSAFVAQEINASVKSGKPTLVVIDEDLGAIAGVPSEVQVLRVSPSDASAVAAAVAKLAAAGQGQ